MSFCDPVCGFFSRLFSRPPRARQFSESFADIPIELNENREREDFLSQLRLASKSQKDFVFTLLAADYLTDMKRMVDLDHHLDLQLVAAFKNLDNEIVSAMVGRIKEPDKVRAVTEAIHWLQYRARTTTRVLAPENPPFAGAFEDFAHLIDILARIVQFIENLGCFPPQFREQSARNKCEFFETVFADAFHLELLLGLNVDRMGDGKTALQLSSRMNNLLIVCDRLKNAIAEYPTCRPFIVKFDQINDKNVKEFVQQVKEYSFAQMSNDRAKTEAALASVARLGRTIADSTGEANSISARHIEDLEKRMKELGKPRRPARLEAEEREGRKDLFTIQEKQSIFEKKSSIDNSDFERFGDGQRPASPIIKK